VSDYEVGVSDMGDSELDLTDVGFADIDLLDSTVFAKRVPHEWFAFLRKNAPVWWQEEQDGPGFWAVTTHAEATLVNRDYEHFSSGRKATYLWDMSEDDLAQQQLIMLNMDPPLHTRYRRLVNKGFTPRMVNQLHERIHVATDVIIDNVIETGSADFVTDIAAELPLVVIAELLGVPNDDRHRMFDSDDLAYQTAGEAAQMASMELYAYASELFGKKRIDPHDDLMSVLTQVDIEGEQLSSFELELFFLLLTVAGNETTRNLISGAMAAFFDHPDQWEKLRADRTLLPDAVEEMLRFVTPVMNFRRQTTSAFEVGGQRIEADTKVVFFHISANRDERVFANPQAFDITRNPNPHIAFGGGGPHFCLGANLARMEIRVMFEHLLDRLPDMELAGDVQRLQSAFISGVKHIPITFPAGPRVAAG
jgi:cholest-4-en-3-one 26-monooxygenase